MSKLLKIKKWLTLDAAVSHLSSVFEEEVSMLDLVQLAEDQHLTLSVNLLSRTRVKKGKVVQIEQARVALYARVKGEKPILLEGSDIPNDIATTLRQLCLGKSIDSESECKLIAFIESAFPEGSGPATPLLTGVLSRDREFVVEVDYEKNDVIDGLWDIPMLGEDALIVRKLLLKELKNDKHVELDLNSVDDLYLKRDDDSVILWDAKNDMPASGLPSDSALVIRTEELQRFLSAQTEEKPMSPRSEDGYLKTIGALTRALAEAKGVKFGTSSKPNVSQIYDVLICPVMPEDKHGLSKSSFSQKVMQGLKLTE